MDNSGSYLDFVGEFSEGKMVLSREAVGRDGKKFLQRMVWFNINAEKFDWNWESSRDGGETWQVAWAIHYTRQQ
ncbi:MAG: hypothetical protein ACRD2R_05090 [Terriglobales bacterium]